MERNLIGPIRVVLNNKPYLVYRDKKSDGIADPDSPLERVMTTLYFADYFNRDELIMCIVFEKSMLVGHQPQASMVFGSDEQLLNSLANILPYLNPYPQYEKLSAIYRKNNSHATFVFAYNKEPGFEEKTGRYFIPFDTSLFKTARKIILPMPNEEEEDNTIVRVLNNFKIEHPTTNIPLPELYASVPIPVQDFERKLLLMREEGRIEAVANPGDANVLISVRLKSPGVQSRGNMYNNYGGNMNVADRVQGNVSQAIAGDINTVFEQIRQEAEKRKEPQTIGATGELETEIKKPGKDVSGIQKAFEKLKGVAGWAAEMAGKLVIQEVARRMGLPTV